MSGRKPIVRRGESVDADFRAALQRLLNGTPKRVAADWKAGRIRLSLKTVAAEAGHSRRLISKPGAGREDLKKELLAGIAGAEAGTPRPQTRQTSPLDRKTLRQQIEDLRDDVEKLESVNRLLASNLTDSESAVAILQEKLTRAQADLKRFSRRVA